MLFSRARIISELKDQVLTKSENLDEDHSALEYARERSQLLAKEAKMLLKGGSNYLPILITILFLNFYCNEMLSVILPGLLQGLKSLKFENWFLRP